MKTYTINEIIEYTKHWLFTGEIFLDFLADDFRFISPFWESNDKEAFIRKFVHTTDYKDKALANITGKGPVLVMKSDDGKYFSIIFEYHTRYGVSVDEAILGTIEDGKLVEMKSIYDLEKTKLAHNL